MPITLPTGTIQTRSSTLTDVLTGDRVTRFRFDLLDRSDAKIGELTSVTGGSVEWTAFTAVKGSGRLQVDDDGSDVDWLNVRIRPAVILEDVEGDQTWEYHVGVFVPAAPVEDWSETGRAWEVELLDKLSILDTDVVTDESGNPITYVAPVGSNVIALVRSLIEDMGESTVAIEDDSKVLANSLVWEVGTARLKVINDLLAAAGYASLWCDGEGQYRCIPYVPPASRTPVYQTLAPFTEGERSVLSPRFRNDRDIYSVPNRYVCVGQGDSENEALVGVATNENYDSPFSYQNRGRWITKTVTGVEATTQEDLDTRALQHLSQDTSVTSGLAIQHPFLPLLAINETIRFNVPTAGLDLLCYATKTNVPFDATALCQTEIREAVI